MKKTFEELNGLIVQWAHDRNIIKGATPQKQASKTLEECEELITAVAKQSLLNNISYPPIVELEIEAEIKDAIGDIIVTLCIQAEMQGLHITDCIAAAYDEIKNRKGEMRNGKFVKEADL
jgi:NTP pyrophosphatase (non-canonical NTP hydrolase)